MFSAFKNRRPWAAGFVAYLFGPFLTMLYLNRGTFALLYLAVEGAYAIFAAFFLLHLAALPTLWLISAALSLRIFGIFHSVILARRWDANQSLQWFSRWYVIASILLAQNAIGLILICQFQTRYMVDRPAVKHIDSSDWILKTVN